MRHTHPLFVRPPTDAEREALEAALRSPDAFVLRRAQIVLASTQGERVSVIAPLVGFSGQAVRDAIHTLNTQGLAVVQRGTPPPTTVSSRSLSGYLQIPSSGPTRALFWPQKGA